MQANMRPPLVLELGTRIRELRGQLDLTVDALAERSGISRRMLTQVELGQANPSISLLDRVAAGLETTFAVLMGIPAPVPAQGVEVWSTEQGSWAYLLSAIDLPHSSIEMWKWRLVGGDSYTGPSQGGGGSYGESILHVIEGRLSVSDHKSEIVVGPGESVRSPFGPGYKFEAALVPSVVFLRVVAVPRGSGVPAGDGSGHVAESPELSAEYDANRMVNGDSDG